MTHPIIQLFLNPLAGDGFNLIACTLYLFLAIIAVGAILELRQGEEK